MSNLFSDHIFVLMCSPLLNGVIVLYFQNHSSICTYWLNLIFYGWLRPSWWWLLNEQTKWESSTIINNEVLTIHKQSDSVNMCIIVLRRKFKYELCMLVSFSQSEHVAVAAATDPACMLQVGPWATDIALWLVMVVTLTHVDTC